MQTDSLQRNDAHDVFISYSRRDWAFAQKLDKALKAYRAPGQIRDAQPNLNVFLDSHDFTGNEYFESVDRHLRRTRKLVILCSPDARKSRYVNDEIRRFAEIQGEKAAFHMIPILVSGIPNNECGGADCEELKAFPEELCKALKMPLAADYRRFRPEKDRLERGAFAGDWFKILADIYEVSRAEIEQRERRRQAKRRRIQGILSTILITVLTVALIVTLRSRAQALQARQAEASQRREAETQRDVAIQSREAERIAKEGEAEQRKLAEIQRSNAVEARHVAEEQRREAVSQRKMAEDRLYGANMTLAQQAIDAGDSGRAVNILRTYLPRLPAAAGAELRAFDWYYLWRLTNSDLKATSSHVVSLAVSSDGATLATADWGDNVSVWHLGSRKQMMSFAVPSSSKMESSKVVFSPNAKSFAITQGRLLRAFDIATQKELMGGVAHLAPIQSLAFSRDGAMATTASEDGAVRLFETAAWRESGSFMTGPSFGHVAEFSPDGKMIAVGDWNGKVQIYETGPRTGPRKQLASLNARVMFVNSLSFSDDGKLLAAGGSGNTVTVWDVNQWREVAAVTIDGNKVEALAFSPDRKILVTGNRGKGGDENLQAIQIFTVDKWRDIGKYNGLGEPLSFSPDSATLAVVQGAGIKLLRTTDILPLQSEAPYLIAMTASPKAAMFAAGSGRTVEIWDTTSRGRLALWKDLPSPLLSTAFSSDGKRFALGLDNGEIEISDAGTKLRPETRRLARKTSRRGPVLTAFAFSPDLKTAAGGDIDGKLWLWETATGRELQGPESMPQSVQRLAFSPNGRWLVAGDLGGTLKILNIETGKNRILKEAHSSRVSSITFSPQGDMLATTGAEVKLWDVSRLWQPALSPLATLDGGRGPVQDLAFSTDGRTLATAGSDHVQLWNVHTRQEMMTFAQPGGTITVAFPSQHILAVAGVDGVKLWSAAQDD